MLYKLPPPSPEVQLACSVQLTDCTVHVTMSLPVGIKVVHAIDSKAEGMTAEVKRTTGFLQFKQRHKVHHHAITTANTSTYRCDPVPCVRARPCAIPCLRDCAVAIIDLANFHWKHRQDCPFIHTG